MVKFAGDGSVAHHQDAVGDSKQFLELGRNHDDGMTIVREFIQKFIDFLFSSHVDASGRLVEDQYVAIARKPFCNDHFLLIATGQVFHQLF